MSIYSRVFPGRKRVAILVAAATTFAVLAILAGVVPARDEIQETKLVDQGYAPGHAGMRATIDPEAGGLVISSGTPALELDATTRNALRYDEEGLQQVFHPDGSVSVDLQGRFQSAAIARIGEDGVISICTETEDGASKALGAAVSVTPQEAEVR